MPSGVKMDLSGQQFGRLAVLGRAPSRITPNGTKRAMWRCRCTCGSEVTVWSVALKTGVTRSCGCLQREETSLRAGRHRMCSTPAHNSWRAMLERCNNPSNSHYDQYGGRGIRVCDRWRGSFENFFADMGLRPAGKTLDRVDNDGDYTPENCRWSSPAEQSRNTSRSRHLTFGGETRNLADWAAILGITPSALATRIKKHGLERAMRQRRYAKVTQEQA